MMDGRCHGWKTLDLAITRAIISPTATGSSGELGANSCAAGERVKSARGERGASLISSFPPQVLYGTGTDETAAEKPLAPAFPVQPEARNNADSSGVSNSVSQAQGSHNRRLHRP